MKSKKIIATIVAFAAFMAVATSGLAAVTTTTTYNEVADKVVVKVNVTEATPGSEVTYLVSNSDGDIVYIDQKTADDGSVDFDYKIAKAKISNLKTNVQFGTNGAAAIQGKDVALELTNVTTSTDANATIEFYTDAACETGLIGAAAIVGDGDVIYAKVTVDGNYEIDTVTGLEETATANIYKVVADSVAVTTKATYVAPGVEVAPDNIVNAEELKDEVYTEIIDGKEVEVQTVTKVLKVVGQPKEVGVEYNGEKYPALNLDGTSNYVESNGLCAVRLIVGSDVVVDGLAPYFLTDAE